MNRTARKATPRLKRTKDGVYMVADLLEKQGLAPIVNFLPPLWRPPVPPALRSVMRDAVVPELNWRASRDIPEGTAMCGIDANAGYLTAASSATFAHGALEYTATFDCLIEYIRPGYYLVDAHPWALDAPGSPLGSARITRPRVWVTHHTYGLLRDLCHGASWTPGGHWPDATVYGCWTSWDDCKFGGKEGSWTSVIRDIRADIIDRGDGDAYEALKLGYSQAIQMWLTEPDPKGTPPEKQKKKNIAYRPDWNHTVRSQHAANMFRRAYGAMWSGHPPVQVGGTGHAKDGMLFTTSDLGAVLALPKAPIRLDETGKSLGTFKRVSRYYHGIDEDLI